MGRILPHPIDKNPYRVEAFMAVPDPRLLEKVKSLLPKAHKKTPKNRKGR